MEDGMALEITVSWPNPMIILKSSTRNGYSCLKKTVFEHSL